MLMVMGACRLGVLGEDLSRDWRSFTYKARICCAERWWAYYCCISWSLKPTYIAHPSKEEVFHPILTKIPSFAHLCDVEVLCYQRIARGGHPKVDTVVMEGAGGCQQHGRHSVLHREEHHLDPGCPLLQPGTELRPCQMDSQRLWEEPCGGGLQGPGVWCTCREYQTSSELPVASDQTRKNVLHAGQGMSRWAGAMAFNSPALTCIQLENDPRERDSNGVSHTTMRQADVRL